MDYQKVSPLNHLTVDSRSASLRTYAGDTSLPGGKVDPDDKTIEDTAVSSRSTLYYRALNLVMIAQGSL